MAGANRWNGAWSTLELPVNSRRVRPLQRKRVAAGLMDLRQFGWQRGFFRPMQCAWMAGSFLYPNSPNKGAKPSSVR